jgi:hypothetical protein
MSPAGVVGDLPQVVSRKYQARYLFCLRVVKVEGEGSNLEEGDSGWRLIFCGDGFC